MPKKKQTEVNIGDLRTQLEKLDDGKSKLALSLLEKAEFLNDTLTNLKERIDKEGAVTSMCQGKYSIDRENPAMRSYNATLKNYSSLIKQIAEMIPDERMPQEGEALMSFIANNK